MKSKNPSEKTITNFVRIDGVGSIMTRKGCVDVDVLAYFKVDRWYFIIHRSPRNRSVFSVSEASTGCSLNNCLYESVDGAFYSILSFIEEKRMQLSTVVGDKLVETKTNLLRRNTTNLQTLGINVLLF